MMSAPPARTQAPSAVPARTHTGDATTGRR
jgi:hypothetical protein